ncbi:MAG TPA: sialate O-acetylesterase [Capsulimonadaceae bacterium]|jgi:sialate O-acetylesterase
MFLHPQRCILAAALLATLASPASAKITPAPLFTDNAVLQQKLPLPVWGTADPGEPITVAINGQTATTKADDTGNWSVKLKPLTAGGPFTLTITGTPGDTVTLNNVLVGEVWVCSGQSNMQFGVNGDVNSAAAKAAATDPMVHFAMVPLVAAVTPQSTVKTAWAVATPANIGGVPAVGWYFGRDLRKALNVPIGLIATSWGGTPAEAWTSRTALEADLRLKPYADAETRDVQSYPDRLKAYNDKLPEYQQKFEDDKAKYAVDKAKYDTDLAAAKAAGTALPTAPREPRLTPAPNAPEKSPIATHLFNAMINPLVPYAIKGAIWYQGESNAGRAYDYQVLFPGMISSWRQAWGQGDFPFLFVQLAPFMAMSATPQQASSWAELREAQRLTLTTLKNTGMAVITDAGEQFNIHPIRKEPVGSRLALAARAIAYNEKVEYTGPVLATTKVEGATIRVNFTHADGMHAGTVKEKTDDGPVIATPDKLVGFEIAGADLKYVTADAKIDGSSVIVSSPTVQAPLTVRYGWANYPVANLQNSAGLWASPFKTDTAPWATLAASLFPKPVAPAPATTAPAK